MNGTRQKTTVLRLDDGSARRSRRTMSAPAQRTARAAFDPSLPPGKRPPLALTALDTAWTDLRRRAGVPLVCVLAIATCCMLLLVVADLSLRVFAHQERALDAAMPTRIVVLADVADESQQLTVWRRERIAALPGVVRVVPRHEQRADVRLGDGLELQLPVDGTLSDDPDFAPARMAWGRGLASDDEFAAVLPRALFDKLGGRLIDGRPTPRELRIRWTRVGDDRLEQETAATLPIVGIGAADELPYPRIRVPVALAQRVDAWTDHRGAGLDGELRTTPRPWHGAGEDPGEVNVHVAKLTDVAPITRALRQERYDVRSQSEAIEGLHAAAGALARFVGALVVPVIAMAGLLILALQGVALAGRRQETWLMHSLGVPATRIVFGLHGLQGLIVGTTAFALALIGQLSVGPLARVLLSETLSIPVAVRAGGGGLPLWLLGVSLALSIGLATAGSVLPSTWMLLGMRGAAFKARV